MQLRHRHPCRSAALALCFSVLALCGPRPAPAAELNADPGSLPGLLERARGGEVILLGAGNYPALSVDKEYPEYVTLRARPGEKPVFTAGISLEGAARMRLDGFKFTWSEDNRPRGGRAFINIRESHHIEVANCEIVDDPRKTEWVGTACSVRDSEHVTIRDCSIHHVYFGVNLHSCRHVVVDGLDIGPWTHEDAVRVGECEGPVLVQNCHIHNTGSRGRKGGHVDAIQVQFWSDNVTIRNCHIHGMMQGIGIFWHRGKIKGERRRKNWRIEGNLIYDIYTPHTCTIGGTDNVVVINNTFPQGVVLLYDTTGAVVKNNIFAGSSIGRALNSKAVKEADYNLWITKPPSSTPMGPHCLAGDPKFVNAPACFVTTYWGKSKDCTRTRFITKNIRGKIAVGDYVELMNPDGMARDGVPRKVIKVGDNWLEVDQPTEVDPAGPVILIYNWKKNNKNLQPDYRLRPDSPAIDSADGGLDRGKDMEGHTPFDAPGAPNKGAGQPAYLDRGAFEYLPAKK